MPKITYEVPMNDGSKASRTANAIDGIAIVRCRNIFGDTCWQLDHTATGMRLAMVETQRQAQRLRRDLLALTDWRKITGKGIEKDLRIKAYVAIQQYPVPPFAVATYTPEN